MANALGPNAPNCATTSLAQRVGTAPTTIGAFTAAKMRLGEAIVAADFFRARAQIEGQEA